VKARHPSLSHPIGCIVSMGWGVISPTTQWMHRFAHVTTRCSRRVQRVHPPVAIALFLSAVAMSAPTGAHEAQVYISEPTPTIIREGARGWGERTKGVCVCISRHSSENMLMISSRGSSATLQISYEQLSIVEPLN
jgi:hypothetical protein